MNGYAETVLRWLTAIPDGLLYLVVASAAAIENVIPPFPGDVVVVVGGIIVGAGGADRTLLFLLVWLANTGSALLVYALGRRYGASFFTGRLGSFLLAPAQMDALAIAYRRYGFPIIFFSRFLPIFRPMVPVFAGVVRLGFWGTSIPILAASAIWYGLLISLGSAAGANWRSVVELVERIGGWLGLVALGGVLALVWWWWRSRSVLDEPRT